MHLTTSEIATAIADDEWQKFRLSLRGKPTEEKLNQLAYYLDNAVTDSAEHGERLVRVQNYLNALSRGGQIAPCNLDDAVFQQIQNATILR